MRWHFTLLNERDDALVLTFSTSQLGDVVLCAGGVAHHTWSRGRAFAQLLNRQLAAGEPWTFCLEDAVAPEPGEYTAVASVACEPTLPHAHADVIVAP